MQPVLILTPWGEATLADTTAPLPLDRLLPGGGPWEVEIGFGKGRYLLEQAVRHPRTRFLGIEMASKYFRLASRRARHRRLTNVLLLRGSALLVASALLPRRFARAVHVYFPDPWPKSRHRRRRLFDVDTVDLLVGMLNARGRLLFATDFLGYGERVREVLEGIPGLDVRVREEPWEGGPRTNYESKYMREGRPILRLEAELRSETEEGPLHPLGAPHLLVAALPADRKEEEGR